MRFSQENVNEVSKQGSFSPADSSLVVSEEKPHFRESDKRDSRRNLWCQEECAVETPPPAPPQPRLLAPAPASATWRARARRHLCGCPRTPGRGAGPRRSSEGALGRRQAARPARKSGFCWRPPRGDRSLHGGAWSSARPVSPARNGEAQGVLSAAGTGASAPPSLSALSAAEPRLPPCVAPAGPAPVFGVALSTGSTEETPRLRVASPLGAPQHERLAGCEGEGAGSPVPAKAAVGVALLAWTLSPVCPFQLCPRATSRCTPSS